MKKAFEILKQADVKIRYSILSKRTKLIKKLNDEY